MFCAVILVFKSRYWRISLAFLCSVFCVAYGLLGSNRDCVDTEDCNAGIPHQGKKVGHNFNLVSLIPLHTMCTVMVLNLFDLSPRQTHSISPIHSDSLNRWCVSACWPFRYVHVRKLETGSLQAIIAVLITAIRCIITSMWLCHKIASSRQTFAKVTNPRCSDISFWLHLTATV